MDNRRPSQGRAGYPGNRDRQMQPRKVFIAEHADEPEQPMDEEQHDEPHQEQDDTHADQDDDQNDLPEDEHPGEADELPDLTEVAEVLTVTAKRLSGLKLGRKFTGGPRKDTAALKKETHCQACGEKGHWKGDPECSMTPKPNASTTAAPSTSRTTAPGSQGVWT